MSIVDLGFVEECEEWQVKSNFFPSKVGRKPAWLNLINLPTAEDLRCSCCSQQLIFLCQVYVPYEDDAENFHRTLFMFICKNQKCCKSNSSNNVKVFRSSLRRENKFYPYEPPNYKQNCDFDVCKWVTLCSLCGCLGDKHCSKCKEAVYCSREHQIIDWKQGHKNRCSNSSSITNNVNKYLFPEFEIVMEQEDLEIKIIDENEEIKKFLRLQEEGRAGTLENVPESELEVHAQVSIDKVFSYFKKRILQCPDQILRYEKGGEPLYIASEPKPDAIPNCEYCGSPRQFEFQIMPQLLTVLKETELDWGVLLVYTCKNSCTNNNDYKNEFVFKQDVTSS